MRIAAGVLAGVLAAAECLSQTPSTEADDLARLRTEAAELRAQLEALRARLAAVEEALASKDRAAGDLACAPKREQIAAKGGSPYEQATAFDAAGCGRDAVRLYTQAARAGNGKAAVRLGEIYDKGLLGVRRDYAQSLKWYNAARVLGEDTPMTKGR